MIICCDTSRRHPGEGSSTESSATFLTAWLTRNFLGLESEDPRPPCYVNRQMPARDPEGGVNYSLKQDYWCFGFSETFLPCFVLFFLEVVRRSSDFLFTLNIFGVYVKGLDGNEKSESLC